MQTVKLFNQPPRDPERIDRILTEIGKIWKKYPDVRFYQLLSWFETEYSKKDKFYVEDKVLEDGVENFKNLRGIS
jgi:hypothetical protein